MIHTFAFPQYSKKNLHFCYLSRKRPVSVPLCRSMFCWWESEYSFLATSFPFPAFSLLSSCWWLLEFNLFASLLDNISDSDFSFSFVLFLFFPHVTLVKDPGIWQKGGINIKFVHSLVIFCFFVTTKLCYKFMHFIQISDLCLCDP